MTQDSSSTDTPAITIFLGDSLDDANEERFLNMLCRDLAARRVSATIFANLQAGKRRDQRQIDFLVLTPQRLAHVELKTLDPSARIDGGPNGPWTQHFANGVTHTIAINPYRQAQKGSYALSDSVAELVNRHDLPDTGKPFFKDVDTLVCIAPDIPVGSTLDSDAYVTTIGYPQLLDRLTTPGRRPQWSPDDWDAFARGLRAYGQEEGSPLARRALAANEALAEYRTRFAEHIEADLHELVPLGIVRVTAAEEKPNELAGFEDAVAAVLETQTVVLGSAGGSGKTHLATHVAAELTRRGVFVIWARCAEYEQGHLPRLFSRATAPFSTETPGQLAGHAGRVGDHSVIVLDGFNETTDQGRADLVAEVHAFAIRYPSCAVLITSNVPVPAEGRTVTFSIERPSGAEREALLSSHGARAPERISEAFTTPYELAIAAECEADLAPSATTADLYGEYVHRRSPSEVGRTGLRSLALAMVDEMRGSMRVRQAAELLASASGLGLGPEAVDSVLSSPLLVVEGGRVRFSHELLERHLAAEALVRSAADAVILLEALASPARQEIRRSAVAVVSDPGWRATVLAALAEPDLYAAAGRGEMGPRAAADAHASIRGALADATFAVEGAVFVCEQPEPPGFAWSHWEIASARTPNEQALLVAAAELVAEGFFVDEVCDLLDRTDARVMAEARILKEAGAGRPVSAVLSGTVLMTHGRHLEALGSTVILDVLGLTFGRRCNPSVAGTIYAGAGPRSWCRLHLASQLMHGDAPDAVTLIPAIIRSAWDAQGYHLRIQALQMIPFCGWKMDDAGKDALADVLNSFETQPGDWAYNNLIIEGLQACDRLAYQPPSAAELADRIRTDILDAPENDEVYAMAAGACSSQWENEDIVGPYYTAIHEELTEVERVELFVRAAAAHDRYDPAFALEQLCYLAPTGDAVQDERLREIFSHAADGPPSATGMIDEQLESHVFAVRGLARLGMPLPTCPDGAPPKDLAWSLVDHLVASLENPKVDISAVWDRLLTEVPGDAIDAVFKLRWAGHRARTDRQSDAAVLGRLIGRDPGHFRQLFLWGLAHRAEPRPTPLLGDWPTGFMIRELGRLGDDTTVEVLRPFLAEPTLADSVVRAIRDINGEI